MLKCPKCNGKVSFYKRWLLIQSGKSTCSLCGEKIYAKGNYEYRILVSGYALVSKNIINKKGRLKYCKRRKPTCENDTGWIFFSIIDDDEYCSNNDNFEFIPYTEVMEKFDVAVVLSYNLPIGSYIQLATKWGKRIFVDNYTGKVLDI